MKLNHPKSLFAVIGFPIDHSLSPMIHKAFAKQWSADLDYQKIEAAPDDLPSKLQQFVAKGGYGLNVTMPHKQSILAYCGSLTERAERAQAVNSLYFSEGAWHGDNTDGVGLVADLTQRYGLDLRGRRTLLLGAGGAAYGISPAILDAGISELMVCNRSPERVDKLLDTLAQPNRVHSCYWEDLSSLGYFDLVINATSAGRSADALKLPFDLCSDHTVCVDLSYGRSSIDFLAWAKTSGCGLALDGLGMLVEQAAESFYGMQGVRPETDEVYAQLRRLADGEGASE